MIRSALTGIVLWASPIALALPCTVAPEQGIPMMVKNESSDYLDSFEAVFLGTIVDVERKGDTTLSATFRMTVDVSRWWKGEPDDSVVIETDFGICNAALLAGQSYVFFAERTLDGEYGPRVNWAVLAGAPDLPELLDAALQSP